ncbi:hypothetical protein BN134_1833 [Cronobacter dublinensis 1210]|uniref:Uncharacterized protein n=2 Tax=Cronobacter dublinensis TaxID=413497 RepID=A0A9Q4SZF3_9ENTR|nr:hypothetical protein [Cronobacter dublinensis]EGT5660746.1 hypothetical protein [Cronobacter dublinensis subsp. dublinensis]CCJ81105.1 hypothetical protein BN134_1833 [Cronobacter dublinensis 1210]CCJ84852.1 hypothetical protein BN133_1229 [Cronobacter dublinensis 582]EGT4378566.1 hypothetical protein [Cronobacter dublinensis]
MLNSFSKSSARNDSIVSLKQRALQNGLPAKRPETFADLLKEPCLKTFIGKMFYSLAASSRYSLLSSKSVI